MSYYYGHNGWHFRNNNKRKKGNKKKGSHPSLIVGHSNDNKKYVNIGITHAKKRGHHVNEIISDPTNWSKKSRIRDDITETPKEDFSDILFGYRLDPRDIPKVNKIIEKHKKKNSH